MGYQEILDFLSKNNIDDYKTMVATTCDSAWNGCKNKVSKWLDFDRFCASCDEMWCDCEDETGLSRIADYVADYAVEHRKLPSSYDGMVYGLEYGDDE